MTRLDGNKGIDIMVLECKDELDMDRKGKYLVVIMEEIRYDDGNRPDPTGDERGLIIATHDGILENPLPLNASECEIIVVDGGDIGYGECDLYHTDYGADGDIQGGKVCIYRENRLALEETFGEEILTLIDDIDPSRYMI